MPNRSTFDALIAALTLPLAFVGVAQAQELYALVGSQRTPELDESSYAYSLEYAHNFSDPVYATFTMLNEGHVTGHHRDGYSVQLWLRKLSAQRTLDIAVGAGPFRYHDTTLPPGSPEATEEHFNDHGLGVLFSVAAHWYVGAPWVVQLRYNRTHAPSSIDTQSLLAGIGYQMEAAGRPGPVVPPPAGGFQGPVRNVLSALFGSTVVNDFQSPRGTAWAIEYRRHLAPYIGVSASAIDEGDAEVFKRHGVSGQLWLERWFLHEQATVGLGAGPYLARDEDAEAKTTRTLVLLTMSASYQFASPWTARLSWYRTVTTNSRDTDIILAGIGRRF